MADYKIYCLEDDAAACAEVRQLLETLSSVQYYRDPALCLSDAVANRCDILIADIDLPKLDGIELTNNFKKHFPHVPLVLLTGCDSVALARECIHAGADELIRKPLKPESFLKTITKLLTGYSILKMFESKYGLTKMEFITLQHLLAGRSTSEMSFVCKRSARTLESHRYGLMKKCGATNIMGLLVNQSILKYMKYRQEIDHLESGMMSYPEESIR